MYGNGQSHLLNLSQNVASKKKKIHFQTKQLSVGQRGHLTTFILLTDKFDEHW